MTYTSPYPYFGGKSRCAPLVWQGLGNVPNYIEPFLGSAAVLLARPDNHAPDGNWPTETVNDKDGMVSNFWRALQADPEAVARYADWPATENDLHARHWWLVNRLPSLTTLLEGDPDFYDAKVAGWWVWGMACWIGHGFCSGQGPWRSVNGRFVRLPNAGRGVKRQRLHLGDAGRGVTRQRLHLGDAGLHGYLHDLALRMKRVRVCSGDWARICGPTPTYKHGLTGIFLDPPYRQAGRDIVYIHDHQDIADQVMRWAIDNGSNPLLRIVYAGYADGSMEHDFAEAGWSVKEWKAKSGYSGMRKHGSNENKHRERLWFSPHCIAQHEDRAPDVVQEALL